MTRTASSSIRSFASVIRRRAALALLLIAGVIIQFAGSAHAQSLPAQSGRLSIQQLGDALTPYGKNTVTSNGQTYYTVTCGHGQWKGSVVISLSPNGNVIWMTIDPAQLDAAHAAPAELAALLKKNNDIGPLFFSINGRGLRLSSPIANSDMNAGKIKAYLEEIVNTAVDTMPLWQRGSSTGD